MEEVFSKIILFLLFLSILNVAREGFIFYRCFSKLEKYEVSNVRLIGLWVSLSYILTIIFS